MCVVYENDQIKQTKLIVIICHGNILRSQVLEQYLKHYAAQNAIALSLFSAGIAPWASYPNTEVLLKEVESELQKRGLQSKLIRKSWSADVVKKIVAADIVLAADMCVKNEIMTRVSEVGKIATFYEIVGEGDRSFIDPYDHINKRQDPERFRLSFSELDRLAEKIIRLELSGSL